MSEIITRIQLVKVLPALEHTLSIPMLRDESISLLEVNFQHGYDSKCFRPLVSISKDEWERIENDQDHVIKRMIGFCTSFYRDKEVLFLYPANYRETRLEIILEKGGMKNK